MITGYELIEKMYSENYDDEYEDTRLYSTGDDELDDLLEKAFCDGYEYAQKEFGRTGLSKEQAKQFFTKTGNRELNKQANSELAKKDHGRFYFRKVFDPLLKGKITEGGDPRNSNYGALRGAGGNPNQTYGVKASVNARRGITAQRRDESKKMGQVDLTLPTFGSSKKPRWYGSQNTHGNPYDHPRVVVNNHYKK